LSVCNCIEGAEFIVRAEGSLFWVKSNSGAAREGIPALGEIGRFTDPHCKNKVDVRRGNAYSY